MRYIRESFWPRNCQCSFPRVLATSTKLATTQFAVAVFTVAHFYFFARNLYTATAELAIQVTSQKERIAGLVSSESCTTPIKVHRSVTGFPHAAFSRAHAPNFEPSILGSVSAGEGLARLTRSHSESFCRNQNLLLLSLWRDK